MGQASDENEFTEEDFEEAQKLGVYDESFTYEDVLAIEEENQSYYEDLKNEKPITPNQSYTPRGGDILTTSSTSSFGVTGHSGIVVGGRQVLHFPGPNDRVEQIPWAEWIERYPKTRVDRPNSATVAANARDWAINNVVGTNPSYMITTNITSLDPTYCSKITWQSYYFIGHASTPFTNIIAPYSVVNHVTTPTTVIFNTM